MITVGWQHDIHQLCDSIILLQRRRDSGLVNNYGNTTTDHYPVVTRYDLSYPSKPVDFQNFIAKANTSNVELSWNTAHEINSKYFIVERSPNNRQFTAIDTVNGQKDKRGKTDYFVIDNKPLKGKNYYR